MNGERGGGPPPSIDYLVSQLKQEGLPPAEIDPQWMPEAGFCEFCYEDKDKVSIKETLSGSAVPICIECCRSQFGYGFEGLWYQNARMISLDLAMMRAYQQYKQTGTIEEYEAFKKEWERRVPKELA